MTRHRVALWFGLLSTVACSSGSSSGNASAPATPTSPDGGVPAARQPDASTPVTPTGGASVATVTCVGVIQCAGKCADNDSACAQSCIDSAKGNSHDLASALYACILANACQDSDCTNTKCSSAVDACLADVDQPSSAPAGTPPTTGSVPAGLVGTWSSAGSSSFTVWTFEANGETNVSLKLDSSLGTCSYETLLSSTGVTTATSDTYVYHRLTGTQTLKKCGSSSDSTLGAADATYHYQLTTDNGTPTLSLAVVNGDGTTGPASEYHQ